MKKVYTKGLFWDSGIVAGVAAPGWTLGQAFIAEDDLVLIGFMIGVAQVSEVANDGMVGATVGLTTGVLGGDYPGWLSHAEIRDDWNTAPPFANRARQDIVTMLPAEHGISLKEGEVVSLFGSINSTAAGDHRAEGYAILYYVKGTARSSK